MSHAAARTIAAVRIATGLIFILFGKYKITGPAFAYGGFAQWIRGFVEQDQAVGFYKTFLVRFVLVHPVLCARIVGWGELAIGIGLVLGLRARAASVAGAVHMVSLTLATLFQVGHGVPVWRYFGAELDHIPLLFLFAIFFVAHAGEVWGLDGRVRRRHG